MLFFHNSDPRGERKVREMNSTMMMDAESVLSDDVLSEELTGGGELDLVEEIRLRTWARKNYVSASDRDGGWHPVILDEMLRVDEESLLG